MTEFFVLRRFRRVRQREENPDATAFWRRAIDQYTGGDYEETGWDRPEWSEIVQTFSTAYWVKIQVGPPASGGVPGSPGA